MLAAVADFGLAIVLTRIRYVMGEYLKKIECFNSTSFVGANGTRLLHRSAVVAWTFRILLVLCALGSIAAAVYLYYQGRQPQPVRHVIELLEVPR